jgi:hypothetical protein
MMLIELGCIRFSQIFLEPLSRSQRIGNLRAEETAADGSCSNLHHSMIIRKPLSAKRSEFVTIGADSHASAPMFAL